MRKILSAFLAAVMMMCCLAAPINAVGTETVKLPMFSVRKTLETTFEIPVYGLYGYISTNNYFSLNLPADMPGNDDFTPFVYAYVILNGKEYKLKGFSDPSGYSEPSTYENIIKIGTEGSDYNSYTDCTTIPISDISTTLTIKIRRYVSSGYDVSKENSIYSEGGDYATLANIKLCYDDGSTVTGSKTFAQNWDIKTETVDNFDFISNEFASENYGILFQWDHSLYARELLENAESVRVIVKLNEPLNGQVIYSLYGINPNSWWNYERSLMSQYYLVENTNEIIFEISPEKIDSITSYNFLIIYENITLFNSQIMSDWIHVNWESVTANGITSPYGRLSWIEGDDRIYYDGLPLNYARSGIAGQYGASVMATEAYIEVTVPKAITPGDVNGDGEITLDDAILTLQRAMNVGGSDEFIEEAADLTGDGEITLEDAIAILKKAMNVGN